MCTQAQRRNSQLLLHALLCIVAAAAKCGTHQLYLRMLELLFLQASTHGMLPDLAYLGVSCALAGLGVS